MATYFHGVLSLCLILGAVGVGLTGVFGPSPLPPWIYGVGCMVGAVITLFSYCAKCACKEEGCRHVFPGKLAAMLPARTPGKYFLWDYAGVLLPLGFILGFPQFWLWRTPFLWAIFWILVVLALGEIILFVCKGCGNTHCPFRNAGNPVRGRPSP